MKKHQDELVMPLLAGRTLDEQIGCIKRYGNHAVGSVLRDLVLESSISLPKPRETAENLVFFGCYLPFLMPQLLRNYIEILERLGVEYTYLEKEFCCAGVSKVCKEVGERILGVKNKGDALWVK